MSINATSCNLPAVRRQSLVAATIAILRGRIVDGTWPVGARIPREADLAAQLAVGRNTVREAIRALSQSSVLDVRQGDGTYVRRASDPMETMQRIDRAALRDHLELRCILDAECARFAARRRTEQELAGMRALLETRGELADGQSRERFIACDRDFHLAVAAATHNPALEALYRYFAVSIETHMEMVLKADALTDQEHALHLALVEAIAAHDEAAALAATSSIIQPLIDRLDGERRLEP